MTRLDSLSARLRLSVYGAVALGAGGWVMPWAVVAIEGAVAALLVAGLADGGIRRASAIALAAVGPVIATAIDAPALGSILLALAIPWAVRGHDGRSCATVVMLVAALRLGLATLGGWCCEDAVAAAQSRAASLFAGRPIDVGPTYAASRVVILEALLLLCAVPRRPLRWIGLMLAGTAAAPLVVGIVATSLGPFGSGASDHGARLLATQLPWAAAFIVCASAIAASRCSRLSPIRTRVVLAVVLLAAASAVALPSPGPDARETRSVLLYEPGFQNWLAPTEEEFGRHSAGMLGTLPRFVEALGARVRMSRDLAADELSDADALVLINQDAPLPAGALRRVESFVRGGGNLVVVADHTFLHEPKGGGRPMLFANEALHFTHMRFANDSADPLVPAFCGSVRSCRLAGPLRPGAANPSGSSIGGAVHASWPARPLLIAPHAYEDVGLSARDDRRGFLGDLVWSPPERLGDIALAAEEDVGRGRVLVVGDTTGITNLGRPFFWRWWSASLMSPARSAGKSRACAALMVVSALLVIARRPRVSILGLASALAVTTGAHRDARPFAGEGPVLVLEEAVCPEGRAGDWEGDGSLSLLLAAYRAGFVPRVGDTRDGALRDGTAALVVAAPRADPGREWAERILAWVEAGGRLFVATSRGDSRNIAGLLARLDAEVSARVLGPQRVRLADGTVTLREPWALDVAGPWRPAISVDAEVIAATRTVGRGEVFLVGDSRFFRNEALESAERIDDDNVRHLVGLLRPRHSQ